VTDGFSRPFAHSLGLHGALAATLLLWAWWQNRGRERWGDPTATGGGSVTVQAVSRIPLPARPGPVNPVANDTESQTPAPPKAERLAEKRVADDPDAVSLKLKREKRRQTDVAAADQRYHPPARDNQVYSSAGQRAVSPMFGVPGSGGVGMGSASPFGARFGYYEALLREKIGRNWHTESIDARVRTAPLAIVTFAIARDGSIQGVRLAQSSGNYALDASAQRAVYDSAPFPPLPAQFDRDRAQIEFWFELKR